MNLLKREEKVGTWPKGFLAVFLFLTAGVTRTRASLRATLIGSYVNGERSFRVRFVSVIEVTEEVKAIHSTRADDDLSANHIRGLHSPKSLTGHR
jgi:hypothetical protein